MAREVFHISCGAPLVHGFSEVKMTVIVSNVIKMEHTALPFGVGDIIDDKTLVSESRQTPAFAEFLRVSVCFG
jgi:hypothetical protein